MKVFFFSGKGGVGKTTVSSALSLGFASSGYKTLLVSLDPAHSLSLALKKEIGGNVKKVCDNLYAIEVDVEREMKNYLKRVEKEAEKIVSPVILEEIKEEIKLAFYSPGSFELAILDSIYRILKENLKSFDRIVFDTAPSGYTVRLIALPELLLKWLERLINLREEALRYEEMAGLRKEEEDPVLEILKRRKEQVLFLREKLLDEKITTFGVVTTPDSMPIEIARRTIKELETSGVNVKLVVLNRCQKNCKEFEKIFGKKVVTVELFKKEPVGIEPLKKVGNSLLSQLNYSQ
ncbi:ArsA family ATPase [Phorcysia thermohydrogeniphila]|uniref:arsenite-transporting ATPase n=1 Tax=Phorcysia thermohydrogeniphila TaxID=936138 RepID=A0A4R1GDW0_9BACT|nr:ArsA family ATPase [Phorcysia thermohydrogeniphila]TCK06557.1 arsenite-transporting ATPase [Phorcysia thermohydrogeniphila]